MGSTLSVITLLIALLFILVEAGFGALRGMIKELWRVGVLFAIGLILFFVVPGVAKSLILLVVNAVTSNGDMTSIADVSYYVADGLGIDVTFLGPMIEKILSLVASLMIPFLFVGLFFLLKLISWPIFILVWWIIHRIRRENEAPAPVEREGENAKHLTANERLIGAGIGAVAGIFLGALLFMPLSQYSKLPEAVGRDNIALLTGEDTADTLCFWSKAPAGMLYRYTGTEGLFGLLFRSLSEVTIGNHVYKAKQANELVELMPDAISLVDAFEDMEETNEPVRFADVADTAKSLVRGVFRTDLFSENDKTSMVHYLVNEALRSSVAEDKLAKAALDGINELSLSELEGDVLGVVDLVVLLEKYGFTDEKNLENVDASMFSDAMIDESADAIYGMKLAEAVLPPAIDLILETALSGMGVTVAPCGQISDFSGTKQAFKDLLKLTKQVITLTEEVESLTSVSRVKEALSGITKLKDSPFIAAETYANLEAKLLKETVSGEQVTATIQDAVKEHMEELRMGSEDSDIDEEVIAKVQESVTVYLEDSENLCLEDIDRMVDKLEDGSLMEGIDDKEVLDSIRNGEFDLSDWIMD